MANVINRTTYEYIRDVHTPLYPEADWLINPDVSALEGVVPEKYWKVVGDTVVEMDQSEKDDVDAAIAAEVKAKTEVRLKDKILPKNYASDLKVTCTASGLVISTTVEELGIDDETTIVADALNTKYVLMSLIYNQTTDTFSIQAFEKTTGSYAPLEDDEILVQQDIREWSVVANGDTLVEVT